MLTSSIINTLSLEEISAISENLSIDITFLMYDAISLSLRRESSKLPNM
ncbi:MAG: hypothetical protein IJS99_09770 [Synergistaceae bacterium]|nr:hypothetical protein [Synergistaceae bacterium]